MSLVFFSAPGRSLMGRLLIDRELPAKSEIIAGARRGLKDLIRAPRKTIREGLERDKLAVELYRQKNGKRA